MKTRKVESFNITSGRICITDPCYDKDANGTLYNLKAVKGKWYGEINYEDCKQFGNRVANLVVYSQNIEDIVKSFKFKLLSKKIYVDSGQCGIFDYKEYPNYELNPQEKEYGTDSFYSRCCQNTLKKDFGVVDNIGIVSSSGFGDGCYTVYGIKNNKEELICISLVFISDVKDSIDFMDKVCNNSKKLDKKK